MNPKYNSHTKTLSLLDDDNRTQYLYYISPHMETPHAPLEAFRRFIESLDEREPGPPPGYEPLNIQSMVRRPFTIYVPCARLDDFKEFFARAENPHAGYNEVSVIPPGRSAEPITILVPSDRLADWHGIEVSDVEPPDDSPEWLRPYLPPDAVLCPADYRMALAAVASETRGDALDAISDLRGNLKREAYNLDRKYNPRDAQSWINRHPLTYLLARRLHDRVPATDRKYSEAQGYCIDRSRDQ